MGRHTEKVALQAMERGLREINTDISMFQSPGLWEKKFLLFKLPSLWNFVMAALADLYNHTAVLTWLVVNMFHSLRPWATLYWPYLWGLQTEQLSLVIRQCSQFPIQTLDIKARLNSLAGNASCVLSGFPGGSDGKKNPPVMQEAWVDTWVGKIPWRRAWQPTPVFLPEESPWTEELDGQPWGCRVRHDWATKSSTAHPICLRCTTQWFDTCRIWNDYHKFS